VATDIARYPLRSPGEVKANPRLVALEEVWGAFTRDEDDFFRQLGEESEPFIRK
jgi:hydroxymethylglutaryl-CoA synthase